MYACRCGLSLSSTRRAAASTAGGGSTSGLPSVKSKTLSAPRSCLRRAPSSNMRRIHDAFVRFAVTARETIMAHRSATPNRARLAWAVFLRDPEHARGVAVEPPLLDRVLERSRQIFL